MWLPNRSRWLKRRKSCRARYASPWTFILRSLPMIVGRSKEREPKYRNSSSKKMCS